MARTITLKRLLQILAAGGMLAGASLAGLSGRQTAMDERLFDAAHSGEWHRVRGALDAGANVNARDQRVLFRHWYDEFPYYNGRGCTPLMQAASTGSVACVDLLLSHGADLHARAGDGSTALHCAAASHQTGMIRLLRRQGANLHARDQVGQSAIVLAAVNDRVRVVEALLDERGNGPEALLAAAQWNCTDTVRFLLDRGVDINCRDEFGNTPLMVAAVAPKTEAFRLLIDRGADVNARNQEDWTAARMLLDGQPVRWGKPVSRTRDPLLRLLRRAGAKG